MGASNSDASWAADAPGPSDPFSRTPRRNLLGLLGGQIVLIAKSRIQDTRHQRRDQGRGCARFRDVLVRVWSQGVAYQRLHIDGRAHPETVIISEQIAFPEAF